MTIPELAPLPPWISDLTQQVKIHQRPTDFQSSAIPWDQAHNQSLAVSYLTQNAPLSVQGSGGNLTGYRVACRVRDFAISEPFCCDLMLKYWYPRCNPNTKPDFISRIVNHAFRYATSRPGEKTAEALFGPVISSPILPAKLPCLFDSLDDLLAEDIKPEWLVKGYFEHKTTILIFGEPGSLKSFLALDIALCVAIGYRWCDKKTHQGPVFYLAGEGKSGIKRRVRAWLKDRRIKHSTGLPFYSSRVAVHLDRPETIVRLISDVKLLCEKHGPPEAVVIDTLAKAFGAGDESSSKDMSLFLRNIETGIRDILQCTVFIVHHSGHSNKGRARGASTLPAGVDSYFLVTRMKDSLNITLHRPGKMKDGTPPPDTLFHGRIITLGKDLDGDPITSVSLKHMKDVPNTVILPGDILTLED